MERDLYVRSALRLLQQHRYTTNSPFRRNLSVLRGRYQPDLNLERLQRFGREQLVRLQQAFREALLVRVTQERAQSFHVRFESVGPELLPKNLLRFLEMFDKPGQHDFERCRLAQVVVCDSLRLNQTLVQRLSDPGVLFVELP